MRTRGKATRRGFTLVELLVVIVIIGILASFLVVGVMAALRQGKETAIRTEVMGMAAAIEAYKQQYQYYPPSLAAERQPHITRIHPRCNQSVPGSLTQLELLCFWLSGYVTNAQKPLYGPDNTEGRATAFFDFDKERLLIKDQDNYRPLTAAEDKEAEKRRQRLYHPKGARGIVPYLYFAKQYDETTQTYIWGNQGYDDSKWGKVYFDDEVLKVDEPYGGSRVTHVVGRNISKDFVIVSAGLEDKFTKDGLITSFQDGTED